MGILKNIEWLDETKNTIVHKFVDPKGKDQINRGSALTVRESQVAVFMDKGRLADVFLPGFYKLDTNNLPILTKLLSWKYGFDTPFKSDIFYVSTRQFVNQKWGTMNPILLYDPDFGNIQVRGYGTFSFKVDDAYILLKELSGTGTSYKTEDITEYLRSLVITGISDAFGESQVPVSRFASQLRELGAVVKKTLDVDFKEMGLSLTQFNVENFSFPKEVTDALNKAAAQGIELGALRKNIDVYSQKGMVDAVGKAAENPGAGAGMMGAGMGLGMGMGMGNMFAGMMGNMAQPMQPQQQAQPQQPQQQRPAAGGGFCHECGHALQAGAKFCAGCGKPQSAKTCACGAALKEGAKFCPECGAKL